MTWHLSEIPKTAYFFWGNTALPWVRYLTLYTFRMHNPDWKMVIYTKHGQTTNYDPNIVDCWPLVRALDVTIDFAAPIEETFGFNLTDTKDDHFRDVYRSDFLRWYLLHECGGLWADMDILFFRSLESMDWNNAGNFYIKSVCLPPPYNNFLMCAKGSSLAAALWEQAKEIPPEEIVADPFRTGPILYQHVRGMHYDLKPFRYLLQLPLETTEILDPDGKEFHLLTYRSFTANAATLGVHWHGSGLFAKYASITPENYMKDRTTLGKLIRYALNQKGAEHGK